MGGGSRASACSESRSFGGAGPLLDLSGPAKICLVVSYDSPPPCERARASDRIAPTDAIMAAAGVTGLLLDWSNGDKAALERLMPLVYEELRNIARRQLSLENPDHTLQSTALVHEAYLRLVDQNRVQWQNRAQFFGVAARMIRRILLDHARRRNA